MGANSNPSGIQEGGSNGTQALGNPSNGTTTGDGVSETAQALKHDPGLSGDWTPEEQSILEEGLSKYSSDITVVRYAKIAMKLHGKTVRDVALRCKWMSKKESGKRRREDHNLSRKSKDKKERVTDPSAKPSAHLVARPSVPPYSVPMLPMDNDDDISFKAIGGQTGQLLENNMHLFDQITANFHNLLAQENIGLLCQARDNILTILNDMNDMPGVMKQMPPLPVKINEELTNTVFGRSSVSMQTLN